MASLIDYIAGRLRAAGSENWEGIALELGYSKYLSRKIVYGERPKLGYDKVQAYVDYFADLDKGRRKLPSDKPRRRERVSA